MATADQLLNIAESYKGTTESPPGSNLQPFAIMAGHPNGYAWCASYVVACCRQAGIKLPSESAWTPAMAQGFKAAGQWHEGADGAGPGDVLFWDFPDSTTGIEHVSFCVAAPAGGQVEDIGGNTSDHADGSQDNGGGVFINTRTTAWVVGYGRPTFDASAAPVSTPPAPPVPHVTRPTIRQGSRGPDVVYLQRKLGVAADGIFGPITDRAVRTFQAGHHLAVDGIVGPMTWAALG